MAASVTKPLGRVARRVKASVRSRVVEALRSSIEDAAGAGLAVDPGQAAQRTLFGQYRLRRDLGLPPPPFSEIGFRRYSQFDEDGILLFIFAMIGFTNKFCVELAVGSPVGANTTNLITNWGCRGLLIDGSDSLAHEAAVFYYSNRDTKHYPPQIAVAWVDPSNINSILLSHGVKGEIDLFSLDIDGLDYWVWKSLEVIRPRVVVVEVAGLWGPDRAVAVPNNAFFAGSRTVDPLYCGASLLAFAKLGREKGYRLVGVHRQGFNAFFVRDDLAADVLPEVTPAELAARPDLEYITRFREENFPHGPPGEWVDV